MPEIFIHAGYPKCGSTFLQDVILAQSPDVFAFDRATRLASGIILKPGETLSETELELGMAALLEEFGAQDKPLVFSDESIAMGRWSDAEEPSREEPFERIVEKLRRYTPQAQVIFVLRPQHEWIRSWWSQHLKGHGRVSRMTLAEALHCDFFQDVVRHSLRYNKVIALFRDMYGPEKVHVLFMRTLAREPERFVREFCSILGIAPLMPDSIPRNKSVSYGMNVLRSRMNAVYYRVSRALWGPDALKAWDERYRRFMKLYFARADFLVRRVYRPQPFSKDQLREINAMFWDDNMELADMLGLDLGQYGFRMTGEGL